MIRIALDLSGISYVEKTIMPVDWPAYKEQGMKDGTLPFGQLPLLKIDGMNLVESSSILRYLSAKYPPFFFFNADTFPPMLTSKWPRPLTLWWRAGTT